MGRIRDGRDELDAAVGDDRAADEAGAGNGEGEAGIARRRAGARECGDGSRVAVVRVEVGNRVGDAAGDAIDGEGAGEGAGDAIKTGAAMMMLLASVLVM